MTSSEGILSHKTPYSGSTTFVVGNGTKLPILHVGQSVLNTFVARLCLNMFYIFLIYSIICYLCFSFVKITIVLLLLMNLLRILGDTTMGTTLLKGVSVQGV